MKKRLGMASQNGNDLDTGIWNIILIHGTSAIRNWKENKRTTKRGDAKYCKSKPDVGPLAIEE
jgi:hypothetical protein